MIWIILFFIIILISAALAFRSMKDYEEFPDNLALNTLFFVGNPQNFTDQILKNLHRLFLDQKQFFSLEKLYKGSEKALVIFGPRQLAENLPELNLVEIEDYLDGSPWQTGDSPDKRVSVNQTLTWLIRPKTALKKQVFVGPEIKNLKLKENQKFFVQAVCLPENGGGGGINFQSTLRVMVVDNDPIEKIGLAKMVQQAFLDAAGLAKHEENFPEQKKFESFKQRSLIPKEVSEFPLSDQEIFNLLS